MSDHPLPALLADDCAPAPFALAPAEFPAPPHAFGAEAIALASLVHHGEHVDHFIALEIAYGAFRTRKVDFMAVVRDGRVIGLCSRGQIGFIMGSRFGFALYSHSPIESAMVPAPLIVTSEAPVRSVLDRALARRGEAFHEDVVLVDPQHRLLGLIQAETLAQLQSRLVAEQLEALRQQHEALRRQNLELFRANHAARQSHGRYLGLFESHTLGVALLDADGGIHEHNRRLAELLGFEDDAALVSLTAWVEEKERPGFLALLAAQACGDRSPATREFTLLLPGRGPRTFRCSTGWIKETGQICACLDDISEQRLLERKLLRQEKQTLLDTLVGGIAHELNNKLTPVQGFAELIASEVEGGAQNHARYIQKSVDEAAQIIRQLLQLSKPSVSTLQSTDLRTVVEETLVMLRFQIRAARCTVHSSLPAEPLWLLADPGQLKQVALNLVLNALQATESRRDPALTVELQRHARQAVLVVADNGCGIAPEIAGRIFDPFFTTKGPERGTGLGLSICFSLIRQHGGEISFESTPGAGTRFMVTLPRDELAAPALVPGAATSDASAPSPRRHGKRVLIVEDDDIVRLLLQEMMRAHFGCEIELATNGAEALALLERAEFSVVLSDVQMPVMNGIEFYRHLLEQAPEQARRFVFLTGHPGAHAVEAEIERWKVPLITKPFSRARLAAACAAFLA